MGVEGCHQDEGDIDVAGGVEMLDLSHSQVEECHIVLDLQSTLSAGHAHGCTQSSIDFENSELVQVLRFDRGCQVGVGHDLISSGRLDAFPVAVVRDGQLGDDALSRVGLQFSALRAFSEVAREEVEERLHLSVECLQVH